MLMSDTTFHLEESLTHLAKIHSLRASKEDTASWNALPENERSDLEAQLRQAEGIAPFHTGMGRDHAELMRDFTATTKEPFLVGEIVDRLAAVSSRSWRTWKGILTFHSRLMRTSPTWWARRCRN